jgi:anti-sigma-K factor RskA
MNNRRPEPHILAGAYAMDALTGADKARFERHLARCPECAREISEFAEATARLAVAAALPPPAALKDRTLAATERARQLPPATRQSAAPWRARHAAASGPARGLKAIGPPWWRPWIPRLALAAACAFVALAGILGVTARTAQHQLAQDLQRSHQVAAVLTARDATMLDAQVTTGGTATIVMSRQQRALVFAATGLRTLPSTKCYELWLLGPGGDKPAGMLPTARQGKTGPVIASGLAPADRLGLTIEPAGGSRHPTAPMILLLAL